MIPIMTGVIPFGAVMGSVAAEAKLKLYQSVLMNIFVFAGASQLAAVDLMTKHTPIFVVVVTALIINLRMVLYSAALAPVVQKSSFWTKLAGAYFLTDQSFALMSANAHRLHTQTDAIRFYFGSAVCMVLTWNFSVLFGYLFGNFAPPELALDYAVPLSFIVLVIPTLKNYKYKLIAVFSFLMSISLRPLPYNLGLITTAVLAMGMAIFITQKKPVVKDRPT